MENRSDFNEDIKKALECVRKGGIILYPTDTVWGIGCDARNSQAVKKIFDLKKRADSKSMIVLVDSINSLERIIPEVPEVAYKLIEVANEPLTIIYENPEGVAPELIAEDNSLGVRVSAERFSNELCRKAGFPIVSSSANISGEKSPECYEEISDDIKTGVDYVVGYRQSDNTKHKPSHIIKLGKTGEIKIIR